MEKKGLVFITGGARSGKSTFAEEYGHMLAGENRECLHYIATSKASDGEMRNRIKRHKIQRIESGLDWKTWECPVDIQKIAASFKCHDIVLLDCLTLLVTNELFRDGDYWASKSYQTKVFQSIIEGIKAIKENSKVLLIVSNEVLYEPITNNSLVQTYQCILGNLHQQIVQEASIAFIVEASIPVLMKGR